MGSRLLTPQRRGAVDVAVLAWALAWALAGWGVARSVHELADVARSAQNAGAALERSGEALGALDVPVLGGGLDVVASEVRERGRRARTAAEDARDGVTRAAVLLGLAVFLVPTLPVAAVWLPLRARWRREAAALRTLLAAVPAGEAERLLAVRALAHLPYRDLLALGRPWEDYREGRYAALAAAERARTGLEPTDRRRRPPAAA